MTRLIADSGATKTYWILTLNGHAELAFETPGISPYLMETDAIIQTLQALVRPKLLDYLPNEIYYYGTGLSTKENQALIKDCLSRVFKGCERVEAHSDLVGAARALCNRRKGIACILGTGSNSCVYDGTQIIRNNPAPGYVLGDEGAGVSIGRKVLQHFIYQTFDEELFHKFNQEYGLTYPQIIDRVYRQPWPNRFIASFAPFCHANRGHFMIENILEDCFSEFFMVHLYKYPETWVLPIHFSGTVAWKFSDVLQTLCNQFELELGTIVSSPMQGLMEYHNQ